MTDHQKKLIADIRCLHSKVTPSSRILNAVVHFRNTRNLAEKVVELLSTTYLKVLFEVRQGVLSYSITKEGVVITKTYPGGFVNQSTLKISELDRLCN